MSKLGRLVPSSAFGRSVSMVAAGTAAGQAVILLASPIIARLYEPTDFGALTIYSSVLSILAISALCYEFAIPLPEDDGTALNVLVLAATLVVMFSGLFGLVLLLAGQDLMGLVDGEVLSDGLWLFPLGMAGMGLYEVFKFWAIRQEDFRSLALTKVVQGGALVSVQTGLGLLVAGPIGLIVGDICGRSAGVTTLIRRLLTRRPRWRADVSFDAVMSAGKRYRRFPLLITISIVMNNSGLYLPALVLASFYGRTVAGWFGFSHRILAVPVALVGQAVAQVFYGEFARAARDEPGAVKGVFEQTTARLVKLGVFPALLLMVGGQLIFRIVFGDAWEQAGLYAQMLSLMLLVQFVSAPLSQTLVILERQGWQVAWDVSRLILTLVPVVVAREMGLSASYAVAGYGAGMTVAYIAHWLLSRFAVGRFTASQPA